MTALATTAMTEQEYRAYPVPSFSSLKNFITKTPAHFLHKIKQTKAMQMGTAKHMAILEPEEFKKKYEKNQWDSFRKKEAKEYRDQKAAQGITVLNEKEYEEVRAAVGIAYNHPAAAMLLKGAEKEVKLFFDVDGVRVKGMTDALKYIPDPIFSRLNVVDVKCMPDVSDYKLNKRINDWAYQMPMQLATYRRGALSMYPNVSSVSCWVIGIETGTSLVNVKKVPEEIVMRGDIALRVAIKRYKECMKLDHFAGYEGNGSGATVLELDDYCINKYDELKLEL